MNEGDFDIVIDGIVNNNDFEKSNTDIETFDIIEEIKYPQDYEIFINIMLDDLIEKKLTTIKYKRCLNEGVKKSYLFS